MDLTDRHRLALRIISGRQHGAGRHRPEDLTGLDVEVAELIRDGLVRLTTFGRVEQLTRAGALIARDLNKGR